MSFYRKHMIGGTLHDREVGVIIDKDEDSVSIENRVVTFKLSQDKRFIIAEEDCDKWFSEDLPKNEVKMLIEGLQELYNKMVEIKDVKAEK